MTLRVPFIRYIATSNAGDAQRLYCAVKCAMDLQVDDQELLWEIFVERCSRCQLIKECWRGGRTPRPRSAEPHFAFARELDLIEWRYRWLATLGSGIAYLKLWEHGRRPPTYFLLAKLLEYDRAFLIPFLKFYLEGVKPYEAAVAAWYEVWKKHGEALARMEPPIPEKPDGRTKAYHSRARLSLLKAPPPGGMGLTNDQLAGIVKEFELFAASEALPDDLFFRLSKAIDGVSPEPLPSDDILSRLKEAFLVLKGTGYASARAAYGFINEIILPGKAVSWSEFLAVLRMAPEIQLRSSFRTDDMLFKVGN